MSQRQRVKQSEPKDEKVPPPSPKVKDKIPTKEANHNGGVTLLIALVVVVGFGLYFNIIDSTAGGASTSTDEGTIKSDVRVFTLEDLKQYDGTIESNPLYLVVLNQVYDVTEGKQYYEKGQGYNIFVGKDSSRAFVTGDFDPNKKHEIPGYDIFTNFTDEQVLGVKHWDDFYKEGGDRKTYFQVGVLYIEGGYYNIDGSPNEKHARLQQLYQDAKRREEQRKEEIKKYPHCNSKYRQNEGGKVWCANEEHVPRKGQMDWDANVRCACYTKEFADQHPDKLSVYEGCAPDSNECKTAQ